MVYDDFNNGRSTQWEELQAADSIKLLGKGVIKVVQRVDEAKENNCLDLSGCQLVQIPNAIYFMMRDNPLTSCNLSSNVISKFPSKLPMMFNHILDLNLSSNQMSIIPEEITNCQLLERLDISRNSFIHIPGCLFLLRNLKALNVMKNYISDVDIDFVKNCPSLESLNLQENPLSKECHGSLEEIKSISIILTPKKVEDWEDLTI